MLPTVYRPSHADQAGLDGTKLRRKRADRWNIPDSIAFANITRKQRSRLPPSAPQMHLTSTCCMAQPNALRGRATPAVRAERVQFLRFNAH